MCKLVKSQMAPKGKISTRQTKRPFELVHTDLIGSFASSLGGARYVLVLVDDYSRYSFCYLLKSKTEVFNSFKSWVKFVERLLTTRWCNCKQIEVLNFYVINFRANLNKSQKKTALIHLFRMVWLREGMVHSRP